MNLLNRLKKLEEEYLVRKMEPPKFIIKFVDPQEKNKPLNKLANGGVIYERRVEESESEFINRVAGLNKDNLIFELN